MWVPDSVVSGLNSTSVIAFLLVFLIGYYWLTTPTNLPPGPRGLPVVGNMLSVRAAGSDILGLLAKWRQQYGDVFTIKLGSKYMVVVSSYKLMHDMYIKQKDVFSGRPSSLHVVKQIVAKLGKGIAFNEGPQWKELRRVTLMTLRDFGVGKTSLEQRVHDEARAIVEVLDKGQGQPVSIRPLFSKFSANIICGVVLGNRFDYDDETFLELIEMANRAASGQLLFAPVNFVSLTRFLPSVKKDVDTQVNAFLTIDNFLNDILKDHELTYDPEEVRDFVDLYLKTRAETKDTRLYEASNMRRVIVDLLSAGTETTATSIDWIILHLIAHPHVQTRCHQEIDRVIGHGRMATLEDRKDLPYIMAVITETWRLVPVAPLGVPRTTLGEGEVGGYRVPKDSLVLTNIWEMHHESSVWPDPLQFQPKRFLDKTTGQFCPPRDNFVPFSNGARVCIGESLARMEVFLLFCTLLQTFTFTMAQGHTPDLQGQLGITFVAPIQPVIARRR